MDIKNTTAHTVEVPEKVDIYLTGEDETFVLEKCYDEQTDTRRTIVVDHIELGDRQVVLDGFIKGVFRTRQERHTTRAAWLRPYEAHMPAELYAAATAIFATIQTPPRAEECTIADTYSHGFPGHFPDRTSRQR